MADIIHRKLRSVIHAKTIAREFAEDPALSYSARWSRPMVDVVDHWLQIVIYNFKAFKVWISALICLHFGCIYLSICLSIYP